MTRLREVVLKLVAYLRHDSHKGPIIAAMIALALFVFGSLGSASRDLQRLSGVRDLLGAMLAEPSEIDSRPFPCSAGRLETAEAQRIAAEALHKLENSDVRSCRNSSFVGHGLLLVG